jgi:hypothetical protein
VVGEEGQQFGDEPGRLVPVGHVEVGDTRRARVHGGAPEAVVGQFLAGEALDHVGTAHEGVGLVDHDDQVGQAEQQGRSRHSGPRDAEDHRDDARTGHELPGCGSPAVDRRHPLGEVGAAGCHEADEGDPLLPCGACGDGQVLAVLRAQGAAILATHVDEHRPPAAEVTDVEGHGTAGARPQGDWRPQVVVVGHGAPSSAAAAIVTWIPGW